jgi:hypothetical protein
MSSELGEGKKCPLEAIVLREELELSKVSNSCCFLAKRWVLISSNLLINSSKVLRELGVNCKVKLLLPPKVMEIGLNSCQQTIVSSFIWQFKISINFH